MNKLKRINPLLLIILLLSLVGCSNIISSDIHTSSISELVSSSDELDEIDISESADLSAIITPELITDTDKVPLAAAITQPLSGSLSVHFIDVGQGDCSLIECNGEYMLIDCGPSDKGTYIRNYMKKEGVNKLKYLILTHTDSDHIGSAASVISNTDIDNIFMGYFPKDNKTYSNLLNELSYKNYNWITPRTGSTYELGTASFTILSAIKNSTTPNDSSIALLLSFGSNKFIFTGDCEAVGEYSILTNNTNIDADVYQVGHHGSRSSSSISLLNAITPSYAVISCGADNQYGHPHAETLNNFLAMGIKIYRTDDQGTIIASSNGTDITWNVPPSENWAPGEPTITSATTQTTSTEQETTPVQTTTATQSIYVCNTNTMKFHYPSCSSVKKMKDSNKKEVSTTRDILISQGYSPCEKCNP